MDMIDVRSGRFLLSAMCLVVRRVHECLSERPDSPTSCDHSYVITLKDRLRTPSASVLFSTNSARI